MRDWGSKLVKMYAYDGGRELTHETAKAGDAYHIGKFISRWLERGCVEIKLVPDDQKGGDKAA